MSSTHTIAYKTACRPTASFSFHRNRSFANTSKFIARSNVGIHRSWSRREREREIIERRNEILLNRLSSIRSLLPYQLCSFEKANSVRFGCVRLPMAFVLHSPIIWPFGLMHFSLSLSSSLYKHFNFDFLPSASMMLLLKNLLLVATIAFSQSLCVCVCLFVNFFGNNICFTLIKFWHTKWIFYCKPFDGFLFVLKIAFVVSNAVGPVDVVVDQQTHSNSKNNSGTW